MLSQWPDQVGKRSYLEARVKEFEAANPSCKVKLTFQQKADLYTAIKSQVRTGQAPDVFTLEPDEIGFASAGYLEPLDNYLAMDRLEDWAKKAWTLNGKMYALPLEAFTVELYYNKAAMEKAGVTVPPNSQMTQAAFTDLVKKGVAAGITPIAQGVGDRPYPGAYFLMESVMRKIGSDDYAKLLEGKLSYKDPRVREVMVWLKELVDLGAYPKNFASLQLGESHYYFYSKPGALTFPVGSWYTGRAFVPEDKGGQPKDFSLGIMKFPAVDGGACNNCKTLAVGGSYVMFSKSPNKNCAGKLLNSFATVENGNKWMDAVLLQSGIKTDPTKIQSIHAPYFKELQARSEGSNFFFGTPIDFMKGKCRDAFSQVLNKALPGGLIGVDEAASRMDEACFGQ